MKLSEIKGENQFEILDKAMPIIERLSQNTDFNKMLNLDVGKVKTKEKANEKLIENVKKHLPNLMKTASKELTEYTSLITGNEQKEISLGDIFQTLVDMLNDPIFINFFSLYRPNVAAKS